MKKWTIGVTALAMGLAASGIAVAQNADGMRGDHDSDRIVTRAEAQARAEQMFDKFDANHDGKLDAADRTLRMQERRTKVFDAMDANHDGSISRAEFMSFTPEHRPGMDRDGDKDGDKDGKGHWGGMHHRGWGHGMMMGGRDGQTSITRADFVAKAMQRFDTMDANHDGKVTKEERQAFRQTMRAKWHDGDHGGDHGPAGAPM